MVQAAYSDTYQPGVPYITNAEYKAAPYAVDLSNLVANGTQAAQDNALTNCIARASSVANGICFAHGQGVLSASLDTDVRWVRPNRQGMFRIQTRQAPVQELVSFSVGYSPASLAAMDVSTAAVGRDEFTITGGGAVKAPFQFNLAGGLGRPGDEQWCQFTYISGWANTVLSASVAAGQSQVTVADPTGIYGASTLRTGTRLRLYDTAAGLDEGTTLMVPVSVASVNGNTVTLSAALANNHSAGASLSAFPEAVKEAIVLLTSWVIKTRGATAVVMETMEPAHIPGEPPGGEDYLEAVELLAPYRVVI